MGVPELLKTVVRQDGFTALYRGVTPSLLGIIPYAGIAFSINEQAKHKVTIMVCARVTVVARGWGAPVVETCYKDLAYWFFNESIRRTQVSGSCRAWWRIGLRDD